jgi:hypothetical protein
MADKYFNEFPKCLQKVVLGTGKMEIESPYR